MCDEEGKEERERKVEGEVIRKRREEGGVCCLEGRVGGNISDKREERNGAYKEGKIGPSEGGGN